MKNYVQHIPAGVNKKGNNIPARKVYHDKPLSSFQQRMTALRRWLFNNHGVYMFQQLKVSKSKIIEIWQEDLAKFGFR